MANDQHTGDDFANDPTGYLDAANASDERPMAPDINPKEYQWRISGLTPRLLFAIEAALEVAADHEEERYPGLAEAYDLVKRIAQDCRAAGFTYEPETSAQYQAKIDGCAPWQYHKDDSVEEG